jgi:hypothetical protein
MEAVKDEHALLVCRTRDGQLGFVLACDADALRWLASAFRKLGRQTPFVIGDGMPIGSDGACMVSIGLALTPRAAGLFPLEDSCYRWLLVAERARRFADLIAAMADFSGPCHQYLETGPDQPIMLVSKGEHSADTLRKMGEQRT